MIGGKRCIVISSFDRGVFSLAFSDDAVALGGSHHYINDEWRVERR